jgi:nucleoid-associated protein YgaU
MNYPLQALIAMGALPPVTYPTNSRYYASATLQYTSPSGQQITYLDRRFVPQPGPPNFSTVARYTVKQGDRLDLIAAQHLGDPIMYWLICDANGAIRPADLIETPGAVLDITMPQGIPGGSGA